MPTDKDESKKLEIRLLDLFKVKKDIMKNRFQYKGKLYEVIKSGKPSKTSGGEPKTDLYAKAIEIEKGRKSKNSIEIKISAKLKYPKEKRDKTGQFIENKMKVNRFFQIFNEGAIKRIENEMDHKFSCILMDRAQIIYRADEVKFPLGWRCDIFLNDKRALSTPLEVSIEEAIELYSGKKRFENSKGCFVNGELVSKAGVAGFILFSRALELTSKGDVMEKVIPILEYVKNKEHRLFDFVLIGVNLRALKKPKSKDDKKSTYQYGILKYYGPRLLFINVNWNYSAGQIRGNIELDKIFQTNASEMAKRLINAFLKAKVDIYTYSQFLKDIKKIIPLNRDDIFNFIQNSKTILKKKAINEKNRTIDYYIKRE